MSWYDAKVHMNFLHFPFLWPACFARKKPLRCKNMCNENVNLFPKTLIKITIKFSLMPEGSEGQLIPVDIKIFNSHWASPLIKSQLNIDRCDLSFRLLLPTFLSQHPSRKIEVKHLISITTLSWKTRMRFCIGFWILWSDIWTWKFAGNLTALQSGPAKKGAHYRSAIETKDVQLIMKQVIFSKLQRELILLSWAECPMYHNHKLIRDSLSVIHRLPRMRCRGYIYYLNIIHQLGFYILSFNWWSAIINMIMTVLFTVELQRPLY